MKTSESLQAGESPSAEDVCRTLLESNYTFFSGVPCSRFRYLLNHLIAEGVTYISAANEGAALGLAAGAFLAGKKPALFIQSSGVGNLINPLSSLSQPYDLPCLILVSGRSYPHGDHDEEHHHIMGRSVSQMMSLVGARVLDTDQSNSGLQATLRQADEYVVAHRETVAIMLTELLTTQLPVEPRESVPSRDISLELGVKVLASKIGKEIVVSTTGLTSRELFDQSDRAGNFYMQGSMGHARAIALGLALSKPDQRVVLLDGDGATLMHMGTLSTVGYYAPRNLVEIVFDNESYGTTGHQYTTTTTTDISRVAQACGYKAVFFCEKLADLPAGMDSALTAIGPALLVVKTNSITSSRLPRIGVKHSTKQITDNVVSYLQHHKDETQAPGERGGSEPMKETDSLIAEQVSYYRARALEYDECFERRGRHDRGPEHTARWTQQVDFLRAVLREAHLGGCVLELACGTGWWTKELVKYADSLTAVDISPEVLKLNRRRVDAHSVDFVQGDIFAYPSLGVFDAVFFSFWLSHVPPERFEKFWQWVARCLRPEGRVFFIDNSQPPEYRRSEGSNARSDSEEAPFVIERKLKDDRRYNIVKIFYEPGELNSRLANLGWTGAVSATEDFFIWGELKKRV